MGTEWVQSSLVEVAAKGKNALVGGPFGSNLVSKDYVALGVPVIRGQNMGRGRYVGGDFAFVSEEKAEGLKANIARPGDLVFTQRGTLGQVAIVPDGPWEKYVISQSQMKATIDPSRADVDFLYYYFSSPSEVSHVLSNAIQTGVPHINLTLLKAHPIRMPNVATQRAIARVLNSLDDKIELNRQMNATLEAMAQALFKSWFVDFDPVIDNALAAGNLIPDDLQARAKARQALGNKGKPLSETVRKQFPDRFVHTEELGWVPEGWEAKALGEIIELCYGKSLPSEKRIDGLVPVYGSGGITGFHNESLVAGPGVVVGRKGTVGSLYWVDDDFFPIDTVFYVSLASETPIFWIFLILKRIDFNALSADSAVPGVNRNAVLAQKIVMPSEDALSTFISSMEPLLQKVAAIQKQSEQLTRLRDTLLPKLLSGEVSVAHFETELSS